MAVSKKVNTLTRCCFCGAINHWVIFYDTRSYYSAIISHWVKPTPYESIELNCNCICMGTYYFGPICTGLFLPRAYNMGIYKQVGKKFVIHENKSPPIILTTVKTYAFKMLWFHIYYLKVVHFFLLYIE